MISVTPSERDAIFRLDFVAFMQGAFHVLEPDETFEPNWHHEAIAQVLLDSIGTKTRKFINAPPRCLKSFIGSVAWVAFRLGQDPTHKFICASYSRDLASHLGAQCRKLMESDWYCGLFATKLLKITEEELVTTQGGFRIATSVGATLTGLGGDTLIVDDPLNANDAYSEAGRKNANTWFRDTLLSRLNDKRTGTVFIVAQRLHQEDLTGLLIEMGWDGLVLPAIAPRDIIFNLGKRRHAWKEGELLQSREPLHVLEDIRRQVSPATFQAQYMQEPVPEAGNMLLHEWLRWFEVIPVRQPGDQLVLSLDTAVKVTATSNYSVCLVFLVRNKNEYYLIDVWRTKVEFPELCKAVASLAGKHKPNAILIEEQASGSQLISECRRNGLTGIIGIRPTADKKTRMYGETAKLQGGSLILPKAAPWLDEFLMEYRAFPGGKHDDQMDALSQFLIWRTDAEMLGEFSADFGNEPVSEENYGIERLVAPSPEELLWHLRF